MHSRIRFRGSFFGSVGQVMLKSLKPSLLSPGNPRSAAAGAWPPLPLMPLPADLESAALLPPFDNMINRSITEQA